jgi:hypothetical protein
MLQFPPVPVNRQGACNKKGAIDLLGYLENGDFDRAD